MEEIDIFSIFYFESKMVNNNDETKMQDFQNLENGLKCQLFKVLFQQL